jgi:SprT protein
MSLELLERFLPASTLSYIEELLKDQHLMIKVTRQRKTRHGSFRAGNKREASVIHISGSLNPYAFLFTLIHEIAHLKAWELYGRKVAPHGKEWKNIFSNLMQPLLNENVFPTDLLLQLKKHMAYPKASTGSDLELSRLLKKYDSQENSLPFIEDIPTGSCFEWRGGRVFRKEEKLRKRYRCIEIKTKKVYLFSPLAEVKPIRT